MAPGDHVFPMTHPSHLRELEDRHRNHLFHNCTYPNLERMGCHTYCPTLVTCFQLLQPGTEVQVKDTQLPEPGLTLQQHSNNMLPQEATAACDQVDQCWHLCRFCHAQLWEENLTH